MTITINIQQLSEEINLSVKTIRTTLIRNPAAIPPRIIISGQRKLLWLREDVERFYRNQPKIHGSNPDFSTINRLPSDSSLPEIRRRGRPTKAEQLSRVKNGGAGE